MRWRTIGVVVGVLAIVGCEDPIGEGRRRAESSREAVSATVAGSITDHVLIISVDGLRPDAIPRFDAPTLQRLMREGSWTLAARTILPSLTLQSHVSMLTGISPSRHGITWNEDRSDTRGYVGVPTIFDLARERGFSTAGFFAKEKFRHLLRPASFDHVQSPPRSRLGVWFAKHVTEGAIDFLAESHAHLIFVHVPDPDAAGHTHGWMSAEYGRAVQRADAAVADVLAGARERFGGDGYTVILTADHGGHGRDHGSSAAADVLIPWIAWGRGVRPGRLDAAVRTTDTAATALWLLGIQPPASWDGRPVREAFRESTD